MFLTAYYALRDLADLAPGERILIHAAAGGVGMAAVQLARHFGAEVFGTASPSKWAAVKALGLDETHLASSRTLEFERQFSEATGGAGFDVVLNSLAREFVDASLRLLPHGGHFIEMGKTDLRDGAQVASQHAGVAYRAFQLGEAGPDRTQQMLQELVALFERGVLQVLPHASWDVRRAPEAFRHMAQARHVGKVVLTIPQRLDDSDTVLITGGTGTLGSLVARHLVTRHGVRRLVLCSRSGGAETRAADSTGSGEILKRELEAAGAQVTIAVCDVSDRNALSALLAQHPPTAVIHTAGVLEDAALATLTPDNVTRVLAPKLDAALHLDALTAGSDLKAFVLFSSRVRRDGCSGSGQLRSCKRIYGCAGASPPCARSECHVDRLGLLGGAERTDAALE